MKPRFKHGHVPGDVSKSLKIAMREGRLDGEERRAKAYRRDLKAVERARLKNQFRKLERNQSRCEEGIVTEPVEDKYEVTEHDKDYRNVFLRAGYIMWMAWQAEGDDALFLYRASRSLKAYGQLLYEQQKEEAPGIAGRDPFRGLVFER